MKTMTTAAMIGAMIALTACQDHPTTLGWGVVVAAMSDEPSVDAARTPGADTFSGSFHARARAAISNGSGWLDLGGLSPVAVALQSGVAADVHGRFTVPVGSYDRVRLTISDAEARLHGSEDGDGGPLASGAVIRVGDGEEFVIERMVEPFTVTGGTRVLVTFDLNSHRWVDERSVRDGAVDHVRVRNSTTVGRQIEPR